ncbi:MAG: hypothetical protein M3P48_00860 [Actinomycetota bacterium]|nr:hypothetical protein [Actinomycetota bacterium]
MGGEHEVPSVQDAEVHRVLDLPPAAAGVGGVHEPAAAVDDSTERAAGAREALPERPRSRLEDLGRGGVGHSQHVAQQVRRTQRAGEAQEHAVGAADPHLVAQQAVLRLLGREVLASQATIDHLGERLRTPDRRLDQTLARPEQLPGGDRVGPRHEIGPALERLEMRHQANEDFLCRVLSVVRMTQELQAELVQRVLDPPHQLRQRLPVASPRSEGEFVETRAVADLGRHRVTAPST